MKLTKEDLVKIVKEELEDRWIPKAKPLTTSSGEVYAYEPPEEWLGVENPSRQMSVLAPAIDLSAVEDPGEPMVLQDLEAMARQHFPDAPYPSHLPSSVEMPEAKAQALDQALADKAEAERLKRKKIRHLTVTQDEKGYMVPVSKEKWIPVYENKTKITKQDLVEMIKKHMEGLFEKKTKVTAPGQKRVSKKIGHLVGKEGKSQEQRLRELIKEEVKSIQGEDVPSEAAYQYLLEEFTDILQSVLGPHVNVYKELINIAEFDATGGKRMPYREEKEKTKVTKPGQKRVSKKIGHLIGKEKKDKDQAAAIAYSMEKRGELKKGGKHSVE